MIAISIFLVIYIEIGLTRLLEDGFLNVKYDLEEKLHGECVSLDWVDNAETEEAMAMIKNNKDEVKNLKEKIKQLKRKKQCQKQVATTATKTKTV